VDAQEYADYACTGEQLGAGDIEERSFVAVLLWMTADCRWVRFVRSAGKRIDRREWGTKAKQRQLQRHRRGALPQRTWRKARGHGECAASVWWMRAWIVG